MPKTAGQVYNRDRNKCPSCNENKLTTTYEYVNAITRELQDPNTFNEIELLSVVLFDKDAWDINAGERVNVCVHIRIIQNRTGGKFFAFLYADSIKYEKREELSHTEQDIVAIERFARKKSSTIIDKLASIFALPTIGYNHVKEGAINIGRDSSPSKRKRINALKEPVVWKVHRLYSMRHLFHCYQKKKSLSRKGAITSVDEYSNMPISSLLLPVTARATPLLIPTLSCSINIIAISIEKYPKRFFL